jgi:hypothetical protein
MTGLLASPVSAETGEAFESAFVRLERARHPVQPNDERARAARAAVAGRGIMVPAGLDCSRSDRNGHDDRDHRPPPDEA